MSKVIQYHSSTIEADAIGNSIFLLRDEFHAMKLDNIVVCQNSHLRRAPPSVAPVSSVLSGSFKTSFDLNDVLLVHFSFYDPVAEELARLPVRKILVYHNITPGSFFRNVGLDSIADACDAARDQLRRIAPFFDAAVGDSEYNSFELRTCGYKHVSTIPVLVNIKVFRSSVFNPRMFFDLKQSAEVNLLFIGRFVPNKRIENIISVLDVYRRAFNKKVNLHLVGKVWDEKYFASLVGYAGNLGVASMLRFHIDRPLEDLQTLLAAADVFVYMSEHEGFMVPLIESFAAGCPVIALNSSAVGETMGGAGILVDAPDFDLFAGYIDLIISDQILREQVISEQSCRALDFSATRTGQKWIEKLDSMKKAN